MIRFSGVVPPEIRAGREEGCPRVTLERAGEAGLSDFQLVALVAGTDRATEDLRRRYGGIAGLDRATLAELKGVRGIGAARASALKAAFELGRRLVAGQRVRRQRFRSSREVACHFRPFLMNIQKEVFLAVLLNGRNELIREVTVSVGCLTSSIVHPREVFAPAVRESAAAVLFVHNHPSGDPSPSAEDRKLTERLVEAGRILGIKVLDHVIVAAGGYASLFEPDPRSRH